MVGNGDWSDFVGFLHFLHQNPGNELGDRFNVDAFLVAALIESFLMDSNGYALADNNYLLLW